jgi:hypothetical protein
MPQARSTRAKRILHKAMADAVLEYDKYDKKKTLCTRCGKLPWTTDPYYDFYKGVKVRIQLCHECTPLIIANAIDNINGEDTRNQYIDRLSTHGQK